MTHNSGCCRRSVARWITVLSRHTVFTIRVIYKFILMWYSTKQGTMHSPTSHLVHITLFPFSGYKNKTAVQLGTCFHWPMFVLVNLSPKTFFCARTSSSTVFIIASLNTWCWVGVSKQNSEGWLSPPRVWFFFPRLSQAHDGLPYLDSSVWQHGWEM
jgi:hypothetical protein